MKHQSYYSYRITFWGSVSWDSMAMVCRIMVCLALALSMPVNSPPLYSGLFSFSSFLNYFISALRFS